MELYTVEGFRIDSLTHHGVKNQKWGVRKYQNPDGSLTPEGRKHYGVAKKALKANNKAIKNQAMALYRARRKGTFTNAISMLSSDAPTRSAQYQADPMKVRRQVEKRVVQNMEKQLDKSIADGQKMVDKYKKDYGTNRVKDIDTRRYKTLSKNMIEYHLQDGLDSSIRGFVTNDKKGLKERALRQQMEDAYSKEYEKARKELAKEGKLDLI